VTSSVNLYDTTYGDFETIARQQVRRETYGEDVGQNSWLTADELRQFAGWLGLNSRSNLLEVGSGSGGPALFLTELTGARVTGIDVNAYAIAAANKMARERDLDSLGHFVKADARVSLPFDDEAFDAVICIDAINHLPSRSRVLNDWCRVLKTGGAVLFTDPIIVTGPISSEEIASRSSIGYFLFTPPGEDERLLWEAGFELVRTEDVTENAARVAAQWHEARCRHQEALVNLEGAATFEGLQRFLMITRVLASERRLSRHVFLARKLGESSHR